MKRKLSVILAILLLLPVLLLNASAAEMRRIVDEADLLTDAEKAELEAAALTLRQTYNMDVVILTIDSLDGQRPQDYADDYFDYTGYGVGEERSGALFLLSMEERDLYVSTSGDARYALTDYGIDKSTELTLPYLGEEDYFGAFEIWLGALPEYFDALEAGSPIDGTDYSEDFYHGDQEDVLYYEEEVTPSVLLSLMIALPIAAVAVVVMRLSMNTKRPKGSAADYMESGSFHLKKQQDIFLYSQMTKTARAETSTKSGGGSSVHTSSSGRSHGGGGRKF